ncbi:MAG: hypothetical protein ACRDTH_04105 [Pseudonocardiaceae bacterium]
MSADRSTPPGPIRQVPEFVLPDRDACPHVIVADTASGCWFSQWGTSGLPRRRPVQQQR